MSEKCPKCKSTNTSTKNTARKVGGSSGTLVGSIGGFFAIVKASPLTHLPIFSHTTFMLNISNALLTAFMSGITGGKLGIKLGELVDENILDNHHCDDCGHNFSVKSPSHDHLSFDDLDPPEH